MKDKIIKLSYYAVALFLVIILFAGIDYFIHGLSDAWKVPDYYFKNKIPYGFLWGVVGLLLARKVQNIWFKALAVAGTIAVTLQVRYFIEGYPLSFVLTFLLIHFIILYLLLLIMYFFFNKSLHL